MIVILGVSENKQIKILIMFTTLCYLAKGFRKFFKTKSAMGVRGVINLFDLRTRQEIADAKNNLRRVAEIETRIFGKQSNTSL